MNGMIKKQVYNINMDQVYNINMDIFCFVTVLFSSFQNHQTLNKLAHKSDSGLKKFNDPENSIFSKNTRGSRKIWCLS